MLRAQMMYCGSLLLHKAERWMCSIDHITSIAFVFLCERVT
jgi:hypothetical protein